MRGRSDDGLVALDRAYLRRQAQEALTTFVAPLSGLVNAVAPQRRSNPNDAPSAADL